METYFNIRYEFDRGLVHDSIARRLTFPGSDYICVSDGVVLDNANKNADYNRIVNGGMFSICDSSYVPVYIKWIYNRHFSQYCGSEIFQDIVSSGKYRMIFLGAQQNILDSLKSELTKINPDVGGMTFYELPFCGIEDFDYAAIAKLIEDDGAEIIWVALGAPKQEYFMSRLKPLLGHGVMIAVGAVFKFFSGADVQRAPAWMVRHHLEFVHRIFREPRKQLKRCHSILHSLPVLLYREYKVKKNALK